MVYTLPFITYHQVIQMIQMIQVIQMIPQVIQPLVDKSGLCPIHRHHNLQLFIHMQTHTKHSYEYIPIPLSQYVGGYVTVKLQDPFFSGH